MTPQQAVDLAKSLREQGYNLIIGEGLRSLFSDFAGCNELGYTLSRDAREAVQISKRSPNLQPP
jgi:hypothetical protein